MAQCEELQAVANAAHRLIVSTGPCCRIVGEWGPDNLCCTEADCAYCGLVQAVAALQDIQDDGQRDPCAEAEETQD